MHPYSVIGKGSAGQDANLPPKPVIWTSKHHLEVQGNEISQPKAKVYSSFDGNFENNFGALPSGSSKSNLEGGHLIDLNRQSARGFKVGEKNGNSTYEEPQVGLRPTNSVLFEHKQELKGSALGINSMKPSRDKDQPEIYNQYAIRLAEQEQRPRNQQRISYTRKLLSDIGNSEPQQSKNSRMLSDMYSSNTFSYIPEEQVCEKSVQSLLREIGIFKLNKRYGNDVVFTQKQIDTLRTLKNIEAPISRPPKIDYEISVMLEYMQPAPSNIQSYVSSFSGKNPIQSRISNESSGHHRTPIFTNSKVEHFDQSSKMPLQYSNSGWGAYSKGSEIYFKPVEQSSPRPQSPLKRDLQTHRRRIFEDSHPEAANSKRIDFGQQFQESKRERDFTFKRSLDQNVQGENYGPSNSNLYSRNLIFEGVEQRNEAERRQIKHKRELSGSNKMQLSGGLSYRGEGYS